MVLQWNRYLFYLPLCHTWTSHKIHCVLYWSSNTYFTLCESHGHLAIAHGSSIRLAALWGLTQGKGKARKVCISDPLFFRMRSEGSLFTFGVWGWGRARQKRNRPQPFATVCVRAIRLSTVASAAGRSLESESSGLVTSQLYYVILAFAEEVFVWKICGAASLLASAEEVFMWVICVVVVIVILTFAEEVSVWVICVAAVILAFSEQVSVWVICVAGVCVTDLWHRSYSSVCEGSENVLQECQIRASYKSVS